MQDPWAVVSHDPVSTAPPPGMPSASGGGDPWAVVSHAPQPEGFWHSLGATFGLTPESIAAQKAQTDALQAKHGGGILGSIKGGIESALRSPQTYGPPVAMAASAIQEAPALIKKAGAEQQMANDRLSQGDVGGYLSHQITAPAYLGAAALSPVGGASVAKAGEQLGARNLPGAAGTVTGLATQGVVGSKLASGVGRVMEPAAPGALPSTGIVRGAIRGTFNMGPKMAAKAATEAMSEHAGDVASVAEKNATAQTEFNQASEAVKQKQAAIDQETAAANKAALAEHQADTAKVQAINEAGKDAVSRRGQLAQSVTQQATDLGAQVKSVEARVRGIGSAMYEDVARATEGDTVPATQLATDVHHAETSIIRGSTESIKQFRELIQKGEPQQVSTSMGTATPGTPLYDTLVKTGAIDPAQPLGFRDLQGYYTELGQKMQGAGVPGDVYRALKYVRESIGKQMQSMADAKGMGDQLQAAKAYWKKYQDTFHDMRPVSQGGSPVARMLRAADPGYIAAPILGKASTRAVGQLGEYSSEAAGRAARLAADYNQMSALPKSFNPKALPEAPQPRTARTLEPPTAPAPEPPPAAPDLHAAIRDARELRLARMSDNFQRMGGLGLVMDITGVTGSAGAALSGHPAAAVSMLAAPVLRHGLGKWLDNPRVIKWLSEPTKGDFAELQRLPTPQRERVADAVTQVYIKQALDGRKLPVTGSVQQFLSPEQVNAIQKAQTSEVPVSSMPRATLGPGAEGLGGITRSINVAGQKVGAITYDINGDTATIHHFGGPQTDYNALSNKLGRQGLQDVVQQLKQQHPEITHVQGIRVGGARGDAGRSVRIEIPKEPSAAASPAARQENAFYTQARTELGAQAPAEAVQARAQQLKQQGVQMPAPPPSIVQRATASAHPLTSAQRSAVVAATMSQLKSGEITQQEADRRIQKANGGGGRKLIRMPQEPN
jgi:hypothetical protein